MNSLTPRSVFKTGKYCPPYSKADQLFKVEFNDMGEPKYLMEKYIYIYKLCESDRFLFFEIYYQKNQYWGYYNKISKKTEILKGPITEILFNNIILPFKFQNANIYDNELVVYIEPYEFLEW